MFRLAVSQGRGCSRCLCSFPSSTWIEAGCLLFEVKGFGGRRSQVQAWGVESILHLVAVEKVLFGKMLAFDLDLNSNNSMVCTELNSKCMKSPPPC